MKVFPRYTLVRYEDLVDNMEEMVKGLYTRLGLIWTDNVRWDICSIINQLKNEDQ